MTQTHAVCAECSSEFDYDMKPGYPRKYCDTCKVAKKAEYEARQNQTLSQPPVQQEIIPVVRPGQPSKAIIGETKGIETVKHVFQNSHEFGVAGDRFKIRFWDIADYKKQKQELLDAGLIVEDPFKQ